MMVSTSPLAKGRSCSLVAWKLYLATHSVPVDHGTCRENTRQTDVGRQTPAHVLLLKKRIQVGNTWVHVVFVQKHYVVQIHKSCKDGP